MFHALPSVSTILTLFFFVDNNVLGFIPLAVDNSTAEDPEEGPNSKRKRRLSVKGLELQQSEKGKKGSTKNKSLGKSTKSSAKKMESANGNSSAFDDEATEDDEINIDS